MREKSRDTDTQQRNLRIGWRRRQSIPVHGPNVHAISLPALPLVGIITTTYRRSFRFSFSLLLVVVAFASHKCSITPSTSPSLFWCIASSNLSSTASLVQRSSRDSTLQLSSAHNTSRDEIFRQNGFRRRLLRGWPDRLGQRQQRAQPPRQPSPEEVHRRLRACADCFIVRLHYLHHHLVR